MTTDEVNEDELFTALVKHRLSGIDPKYVPDDAVANIADAYTEWRSRVERAAAEKALTDAVDDWESGTVEHDEIKYTSDAPLGWGDDSVVDAVMSSGPVMDWLRKRAAALGLNEGESDD